MRLPHVMWVIATVSAACSTSGGAPPLLSATRLALTEKDTVTVHVDVGSTSDFTVTAPANVAVTPSSDGDGPLLSVSPGCDAVVAQDATMMTIGVQETTGARRHETLVLAVTNNKTADCFHRVEIIPFDQGPIACADLDGTGLSVLSSTESVRVDLDAQTSGTPQRFTGVTTLREVLAVQTGQGMTAYGVNGGTCSSCSTQLWKFDPTAITTAPWIPGAKNVGIDVTTLRSPAVGRSDPPDYFVGWTVSSGSSYLVFTRISGGNPAPIPSPQPYFPALGLGAWGYASGLGQKLFVVGIGVAGPVQEPCTAGTFDVTWAGSGSNVVPQAVSTVAVSDCTGDLPQGVFDSSGNVVATTTVAATAGGMNGSDVIAGVDVGPFDGSTIQFSSDLKDVLAYGGTRSVAPTQDDRALLGAENGALLTYYDGDSKLQFEAVDPARDSMAVDSVYGANIAPCLDHAGALVGYAVTISSAAGVGIRVARLPGY